GVRRPAPGVGAAGERDVGGLGVARLRAGGCRARPHTRDRGEAAGQGRQGRDDPRQGAPQHRCGRDGPEGHCVSHGPAYARALVAVMAAAAVHAQPYAAAGGFGAPRVVAAGVLPVAAVAAGDGTTYLVWADGQGVWSSSSGGEPRLVARSETVRGAWATVSQGDLAVAWVERDRRTGATSHHLTYRGEDHLLFSDTVETPLIVGPGRSGPWVAAPVRRGGEAQLSVYTWEDGGPGEPRVLYSTDLSVRGLFAVDDGDP